MQGLSTDRVPWPTVGVFVAGLVAGGGAYYLTNGLVPATLVMGAALLVIALYEREGSPIGKR